MSFLSTLLMTLEFTYRYIIWTPFCLCCWLHLLASSIFWSINLVFLSFAYLFTSCFFFPKIHSLPLSAEFELGTFHDPHTHCMLSWLLASCALVAESQIHTVDFYSVLTSSPLQNRTPLSYHTSTVCSAATMRMIYSCLVCSVQDQLLLRECSCLFARVGERSHQISVCTLS